MVQDVSFLSRIYTVDIATGREPGWFHSRHELLGIPRIPPHTEETNKIAETLGSLLQPSRELIAPLRSVYTNLCMRYLLAPQVLKA